MDAGAARLTNLIDSASDMSKLRDACAAVARWLGFGHFFYGLRIPLPPGKALHMAISGYPPKWRELYEKNKYIQIDPVIQHCFVHRVPIIWDEIERSSIVVRNFFEQAESFGLRHGLSAPIGGARSEVGLFSLAREEAVPADKGERVWLMQQASWFASAIYTADRRINLAKLEDRPARSLTPREKDCLRLTAQGMTSGDIATLLDISRSTVEFHLSSAGQKLGVRGKFNVVARAISLGELEASADVMQYSQPLPNLQDYRH